jgi:hypothetical protein
VAGAATTDPSGGATIQWVNPNYSSLTSLCAETYSAVANTSMTSANGATVLNFEQTNGFGTTPYQLSSTGALNATPALSPSNAVTTLTTGNGHNIGIQWRSFNYTNSILGAPDSTQGVYLVKDRTANDTMVSGTQGLVASTPSGVNGGAYLTFDQNLSKFSVVLNSNANDYSPLVVLFDGDGVPIGQYYFGGVGKGQAVYFGVQSAHSIIRSVWIGQNGSNNPALVMDDIAFVAGPAPTVQSFSFANTATGWTTYSGASLVSHQGYTTVLGNSAGSVIYRSIPLTAGTTYQINCTGFTNNMTGQMTITPDFVSSIGWLNYTTHGTTWRLTECQRFTVPASSTYSSYILYIWAPSDSTSSASFQNITISTVTPTPYTYDTAGMATNRTALGVSRGMQTLQGTFGHGTPLGSSFLAQMRTTPKGQGWYCNLTRYALDWDGTPAGLTSCLSLAVQDIQSAPPGLKFVVELTNLYPLSQVPDNSAHTFWTRPDLNATFCNTWQTIISTLQPSCGSAIWGYDLFNEPYDVDQGPLPPKQWAPIANNILRTIRSISSTAWVVYEPGPGGEFSGFAWINPLPDTKIVYSAHFYDPGNFAQQGVNESLANQTWPTASDPMVHYSSSTTNLASFLSEVDAFQANWPVPVYVGEFSAARWGPQPDTANYLHDAIAMFEARGWSWDYFAWQSWNGWRMDMDSLYGEEDYGPWDPVLVYPSMTDRGTVIYNGLLSNP